MKANEYWEKTSNQTFDDPCDQIPGEGATATSHCNGTRRTSTDPDVTALEVEGRNDIRGVGKPVRLKNRQEKHVDQRKV
jgi:hypothetical protein